MNNKWDWRKHDDALFLGVAILLTVGGVVVLQGRSIELRDTSSNAQILIQKLQPSLENQEKSTNALGIVAGASNADKGAKKNAQEKDLVLIAARVTSKNQTSGRSISFQARGRETGQLSQENIDARLRIDVGNDGTWDVVKNISMPNRKSILIKFYTAWKAVAGNHKAEICVDPSNTIVEANETNNCSLVSFSIK